MRYGDASMNHPISMRVLLCNVHNGITQLFQLPVSTTALLSNYEWFVKKFLQTQMRGIGRCIPWGAQLDLSDT